MGMKETDITDAVAAFVENGHGTEPFCYEEL